MESPARFHTKFQICLMNFNPTTWLWRGERHEDWLRDPESASLLNG